FELLGKLTGRRTLLRRDRRRVREGGVFRAVLAVATVPQVHPQLPLRATELVQAQVGGDGEDPGHKPALRLVPMPEPEDPDEDVLRQLLGLGLAADEAPGQLQYAGSILPEEVLKG